jgi:hypothetical protein
LFLVRLAIGQSAEINDALDRVDMNIESTDHRVSYIGRLDLGGDDGIVDDRTGTGQKGTVRKAGSGNVSDTWGKSRSDSG